MDSSLDFRLLFESAPGLYLVLDPALKIVAVSNAYLSATRTQRAEIMGRQLFEVFPDNPDDPAADGVRNLRASLERVAQTLACDEMAVQKYDIRRPDGTFEPRYWSPVNTPVLDPSGKLRFIIHCAEDVSKFRRINEDLSISNRELRKKEDELDRFFTLSLDMLCISNKNGYFKRLNPAFRLLGYEPGEMLDRPFLDFIHPDDVEKTLAEVQRQMSGTASLHFENRYRCKDGSYRLLKWSSTPDGAGNMYATAHDVTEERKSEREREQLNERLSDRNQDLDRANRTKSDFLSMMSHELRTPLNSIIGFSELLIDQKFGALNERQADFLGNVYDSGRHLLRLINDLLDLSKIEAGRMEWLKQACQIRSTANDAMATLQPLADAKGQRIILDSVDLPPVSADALRLKQIFYNLMSNAIKFTPKCGAIRIVPSLSADGERVSVSVIDNGTGISPAARAFLFKPFSQLENAAQDVGSGLGLALVKQLVELMGGTIGVESEVGKGSRFFFDLPVYDGGLTQARASDEIKAASGQASNPGQSEKAPLALIVDDDEKARRLLELMLRGAGYETISASSGERAVELARERRPSVITLDIFLPGMDGWDVLRILRNDSTVAQIPVVMISVSNDRTKAFSLGATDHLVKPIDRGALLEFLARHRFATEGSSTGVRVLAVDDDPQQLAWFRAELEPRGFWVETASTGRAGVVAAIAGPCDLLLLDLVLPDISGIEVVEQLRRNPQTRNLPIFLITAKDLSARDREQLNGAVSAVLAKSALELPALLHHIESVTRRVA